MNRRGNGLSADTYAPLVDLAPHLADAMLTALGEAGVAAYAAPPSGLPEISGPVVEPASGDVLDRLYVDVEMKPAAEGILRVHLARLREASARGPEERAEPAERAEKAERAETGLAEPAGGGSGTDAGGPPERDEDAIWAEIIAGFDDVPEGEAPWPDEENIREPAEPPREGDDRSGRLPRARVIKPTEPPEFPPDDDDDEEGHYVPPPPPPLPSADPLTKGAWVALIGGPIYLLVTVILDWEVPGWAAFLAVAAFIGGFVTLVLRMGDEPRDPDDGAVV